MNPRPDDHELDRSGGMVLAPIGRKLLVLEKIGLNSDLISRCLPPLSPVWCTKSVQSGSSPSRRVCHPPAQTHSGVPVPNEIRTRVASWKGTGCGFRWVGLLSAFLRAPRFPSTFPAILSVTSPHFQPIRHFRHMWVDFVDRKRPRKREDHPLLTWWRSERDPPFRSLSWAVYTSPG